MYIDLLTILGLYYPGASLFRHTLKVFLTRRPEGQSHDEIGRNDRAPLIPCLHG